MRKIYLVLVLLAGVLFAGKGYSQISVTATGGTTGPTVYTTLSAAVTAINGGTHTGTINISVTASTTETVMSSLNSSGTGSASYTAITIKPAAGVTASISTSTLGVGTAILKLNGADNVTVDGSNTAGGTTRDLSFINTTTGASGEIWLVSPTSGDGATNNTIKNCIVSGPSSITGTACISDGGLTFGSQALTSNSNNTIQNNLLSGHQQGVVVTGPSAFPYDAGWVITGNSINSVGVRGIILQAASGFTVSNNTILGPVASVAGTSSGIHAGFLLSNGNIFNNNITNVNNASSGNGCAGILLGGSTGSSTNVYNNYISNVFSSTGSAGTAESNGHGIDISTGSGYNIYFNTINQTQNQAGGGLASSAIFVSASITAASAIDLRNNILVNTQTAGATTRAGIYSNAAASVFASIDYNDYAVASGILGFIGGTSRTSLAAMITGFGGNANSINVTPTFVSVSNLDLQNIVANEPLQAGITISSPNITSDIHGTTRSANPVIGGHELHIPPVIAFSAPTPSCANNDIAVSSVSITDFFGVPTTGALMPRIYFRKNAGAWFSAAGTLSSGSATSGTWSFTISASVLGGLTSGNTVSYYIVAQNTKGTVVSNPSAGFSATNVNTITTNPTTPASFAVSALPTVASLNLSSTTTCVGSPVTLSAGAVTGVGTLSSYNWSGPGGFLVTGAASSTSFTPSTTAASGQYTLSVTYPGTGCTSANKTASLTVNPTPPGITGTQSVCIGLTTTLHDATSGGIWNSGNTGIATVNISTGVVTGIAAGTTLISYIVSGVCVVTAVVTVNPNPFSISGTPAVCVGLVTTLSGSPTGGTWISNNPAVGSVSSTGDVTGNAAGVATITYSLSTGCYNTRQVSVNANPSAITGTPTICTSNTTVLGSTPAGGTWSSGNTSVATTSGSSTIIGSAVGTANITYTLGTGCINSMVVTVNPTPAAITGPSSVCSGSTITLSSTTSGGVWTPNSSTIAYANFSTGVVTGVSVGVAAISYTMPTGCRVTYNVTGIIAPPAIGGTMSLCQGATTALTNSSSGGTWSSNTTTVATIGIGTGFVTAIAPGTTTITFTATTGCTRTAVVTVNGLPVATAGTFNVCAGSTVTLSNATAGGTWISSNTSVASAGSTSGIITGILSGTSTITYRLSSGCLTTNIVTVNPLPAAVSGASVVCQGSTILLTDVTASGVWSASAGTGSASVSATGTVTGGTPGSANISYTLGTGCYQYKTITINPVPAAIGGAMAVCLGGTATLTDASPSGTWSSSASTIASIATSTGSYSGVAAGNATITYKFLTGCQTTAVVTVNPLPSAITGTLAVCLGSTTALGNAITGGTWTSLNPGVATITSGGVVSGVALGTAVISYTLSTGCAKGIVVTVNSLPGAITGTPVVCVGSTTNLSSTPGGGTWSSANTAVAAASAIPGVIAGVSAGTAIISYSMSSGCVSTTVITVHPVPAPLTGATSVCVGSTTPLSTITAGGTWTSANLTVATVDGSGNVTGISSGLTTISYTLSTGCARTTAMLVNPLPIAISGASTVCQGSNITLSTGGSGTWSSSDVTIATVGLTSGIVTGVTVGNATISFIIPTGCYRTRDVTVNPTPAPIAGSFNICSGATTTLTDADAGGVWASNFPTIASIGATSGVLTGVAPGVANISYTLGTGCRASVLVTVTTTPTPIGGTAALCEGAITTLTDAQPGGTWTSGNTGVATITTATGLLNAITAGTSIVTYTGASGGCTATKVVTVNPLPAAIAGVPDLCIGSAVTFTDASGGGTWASSNITIATAGVTTGVVTGFNAGNATITYRLGTGCITTYLVTVDPLPTAINGVNTVCIGNTTTLTNSSVGGTWSSSNPTLANIDIFGVVTGIAAGTATITYILPTGCFNTRVVTVYPLPAAIAGSLTVCSGQTSGLYNSVAPGIWSSSDLLVATVGSGTGIVTGGVAGTSTITYSLGTGCMTMSVVTVNPIPSPITGTAYACVTSVSDLDDLTLGGAWTSSNNAVATVDGLGVVTGVAAGTVTISYTLPLTGCSALRTFVVQPLPTVITGTPTVCTGTTTMLGSTPAGGTWTSSNPGVATVTGGIVSGLTGGTTLIAYSLTSGCSRSVVVTVNTTPPAITGTQSVCIGSTTLLSDGIVGGTWISNFPATASVGYNTGVVTGNAAGVATITYTLLSGCKAFITVSVQALPGAINGNVAVCAGSTSVLTNTVGGGTWSSANTGIATIGSGSGILVGMSPGTVDITYTIISTGCYRSKVATVNTLPAVISGLSNVCVGATIALTSGSLGGTWSTSNTSVAVVGATSGIVTGVSNNTVTITYTLSTGCQTTKVLTVNPLPSPITGVASMCAGATTVLTDISAGGVWSGSNPLIGTVDPVSGVVTGISQGNAIITYSLGTGCQVTRTITVNPIPSPILGTLAVCEGLTTSLSNLTPGGSWGSNNTFVATVGIATGIVSGGTAGIATIYYTLAATGCRTGADVTVNPIPYPITGTTNICLGTSQPLGSLSAGGTWTTGNNLVATVGSSTGIVTGVAVGTARITYLLSTGCKVSTVVTISPLPANIVGINSICQGSTTTLTNTTSGGNWVTSDFAIASVTSTGVVTGVTPGTATISYVLGTGCMKTVVMTVNPTPPTITGNPSICRGTTDTLSNTMTGGLWTSSNATVATITPGTGIMYGLNPGLATITYAMPTGCRTILSVTINAVPADITGTTLLCETSTVTLHDVTPGGTWSTDVPPVVANVDVSTGVVTGMNSGSTAISYTLANGCSTSIVVTVNPAPPSIIGDSTICEGQTSHLSDATLGGTWSSSDTDVLTIGLGDGNALGVSTGTAYVTYSLGAGCKVVGSMTVNLSPAPIVGPNAVCAGETITLTNAVAGGTWTSDDGSVASIVSTTGVVTGVTGNIDTIRYTVPGGCTVKFGITVNPTPPQIDNLPLTVCEGLTLTLTNIVSGGVWTSSDPSIAPIVPTPSSNIVLGVAPGTVTISYRFTGSGCATSAILTINPTPAPITGLLTICEGATTILHTASSVMGGSWSSSNSAVASIGSGTGLVTAGVHGIATITFTLPSGCINTALFVVNPNPDTITGSSTVCAGSMTTFTDATPFGTWSSSVPSIVTIGSGTGLVTGIVPGNATITYTLGATGCYAAKQVTINPVPPPVLGNPFLCVGSVTFLSNAAAPGGTWSSSNTAVGTVDAFGDVSGITAGTTIITYTRATACYVTTEVTVEPLPAPITGVSNVCVNSSVTLVDAYFGGEWNSSNNAIASVDIVTGVVTGVVAGPVTITYSTPMAHCYVTKAMTVDAVPVAIVGATHLCEGTTGSYFNGTSGGTWSTSDASVATIGASTGSLTAVSPNTVIVSYTISNGCSATKSVSVDPLAHAGTISGPVAVCVGTTITLTNTTAAPTGEWSSSNTSAATVDAVTGVVTGIAQGTAIITYITTNSCSSDTTTTPMLINPQPDAGVLSGNLGLCKDYTSNLTSTVPGGVWTSSNTGVATISATGVVTAIVPGTTVISYAVTNVCGTDVKTVTVTVHLVAPHTNISIHPDSILCLNTMYQNFGTDSAQPAGLIYTWTATNAIVWAVSGNKQNSVVNFPNSGTATVKLVTQIASTGCYVIDSFNVTVGTGESAHPEVKYYNAELICTDNTADTYQWGYDDVATLEAHLLDGKGFEQQAYYLPVPDFANRNYWVVTHNGGCYQKTYYNVPTNVGPVVGNDLDIVLFPNPADSRLNIEIKGLTVPDNVTVRVVDMLGKDVQVLALVNGKGSINVYDMPAGIYSVMFISDGMKIGAKTFVKR